MAGPMERRPPPRWTCPLCQRSVPGDVPTCYCGTVKAAVEAQVQREQRRQEPSLPWLALATGLVVFLAVVFLALAPGEAPQVATAPGPEAGTRPAPPSRPAADPPPVRDVSVGSGRRQAQAQPTPEPSPQPTPEAPETPAPSESPRRGEVEVAREEGERRLERTLAGLEGEVRRLSSNARTFRNVCVGIQGDPRSCQELLEDLSVAREKVERGLDEAEDDARRSWVSPGVVRDLRQRHGLEEAAWDDLEETVRRLAAEYRGHS